MELEKLLQQAEALLQKFADREDWSEANIKKGNRDGIKEYALIDLGHLRDIAEYNLDEAIDAGMYGDAAYWRAYLSGWMQAETAARLDVLQKVASE